MKVLIIAGIESNFEEDLYYKKLRQAFNRFMNHPSSCLVSPNLYGPTNTPPTSLKKVPGLIKTMTPTINGFILGAALENMNIPYELVTAFSLNSEDGEKIIRDSLNKENWDVVAISTTFIITQSVLEKIVNKAKDVRPNCKVVIGGPFIIGNETALSLREVDYFVIGDGERSFPSLIRELDRGNIQPQIPGVLYWEGKELVGNQNCVEVNLKNQPIPAWNKFLKSIPIGQKEYLSLQTLFPFQLETTRGCPYRCTFCNYWTHFKKVRFKTAERIFREILVLYNLGVKKIGFWDSTFTIPRSRLVKLVELIESSKIKDIQFTGFARLEGLTIPLLERMVDIGFKLLYFGIESGNDVILKRMKKEVFRDDVIKFFNNVKKNSILMDFMASFIVGFPGETSHTIDDTVSLMKEIEVKYFNIQQLWLKEGADVYEHPHKYGLRYERAPSNRYAFRWEHETMNSEEAANAALDIFTRVHFETDSLFIEPLFGLTELSHKYSPLDSEKNFRFLRLIQEGLAYSLLNRKDCDSKQSMLWHQLKSRYQHMF